MRDTLYRCQTVFRFMSLVSVINCGRYCTGCKQANYIIPDKGSARYGNVNPKTLYPSKLVRGSLSP